MSDIVTTSKTDLARGLIALAVIFGFEWTTDWLSSRHSHFATLFEKEPQVLVFRGRIIEKALSRNRLSEGAIWMTLRQNGCSDVSEVGTHSFVIGQRPAARRDQELIPRVSLLFHTVRIHVGGSCGSRNER